MATSSSAEGLFSVRRIRSANDVNAGAARQASTSSSGGEGPSNALLHPLGSVTAKSNPDEGGVASTISILPTSSTSPEVNSTLKTSYSTLMEGTSQASSSSPTVVNNPASPRPQSASSMPELAPLPLGETNQVQAQANTPTENLTRRERLLRYLGLGPRATQSRRTQVTMVQNMAWGFTQVVTVTVLVSLSGTVWKSPRDPSETEWQACDRPLGIWACLWIGRATLVAGLEYWEYKRALARAAILAANTQSAAENGVTIAPTSAPGTPSTVGMFNPNPYLTNTDSNHNNTNNNTNEQQQPQVNLPHTLLYQRLALFSSLISLSWFLTAHILVYTSLSTCRHSAPHLWWTVFGCICVMYLVLLEVLALGFVVLIVAPVVFIFWNVFLFCIGRHPAMNPPIKPDVGKLSKSTVERLPLVVYIPPPPSAPAEGSSSTTLAAEPKEGDIAEITPSHAYPPAFHIPPHQAHTEMIVHRPPQPTKRSRRFRFFRRKRKSEGGDDPEVSGHTTGGQSSDPEKGGGGLEGGSYEDQYEKGEHPFVILEGNRAACAICLMDFEPPKRKGEVVAGGEAAEAVNSSTPAATSSSQAKPSGVTTDPEQMRLEDSGEGPLRLLGCGHVFHQTCVDPWLTDVSGRCPVCQRKVEEADLLKKKRRRRQQ